MAEKFLFTSEPARDGNPYMSVAVSGETFRLNSNYRPLAEADTWAAGQQLAETGAIVLLFGVGNGYFLRALLKRLPQDAAVIAYEPSEELFRFVQSRYELGDLLSERRLTLLTESIFRKQIYALLDRSIHWSNAKKQSVCIHPQYDRIFPEQLAFFEELIRANNIRVYTNRNTEMHFGRSIASNVALNMRYVPEAGTLSALVGRFPPGASAILVAAGPSLDKNVDELKKAEGRAFIIAVDTSLRTLHAHGVKPDAAVMIDADIRQKYFTDTDFADIPLFAQIQANHEIMRLHTTRKIWFDSHAYLKQYYHEIGRDMRDYHGGASVATAAFSVCAALGFRRIILIGQDLSYHGDVTHAGGETMAIQAEEENLCYVDGTDGGKVKTRHDWLQYLRWYERVVQETAGEIDVIDATEGGALIRGTRLMTLSEAIEKYCTVPVDFAALLRENLRTLSGEERKSLAKYLHRGILEAEKIRKLSQELCVLLDRESIALERTDARRADQYCSERSAWLRGRIAERNALIADCSVYPLVDDAIKQVSIPAITEMLETEGTEKERCRVLISANRRLYRAMAEAAGELGEKLHYAM